jgi:hypothetical protein|tara:strand:+ start:351 stop:776 length:426 start_codon:yes stop_codon:yes gene_type:complete
MLLRKAKFTMTVTAAMDMAPDAFHQPQDFLYLFREGRIPQNYIKYIAMHDIRVSHPDMVPSVEDQSLLFDNLNRNSKLKWRHREDGTKTSSSYIDNDWYGNYESIPIFSCLDFENDVFVHEKEEDSWVENSFNYYRDSKWK